MKTQLNIAPKTPVFPLLARLADPNSTYGGAVVLFSTPSTGVVVVASTNEAGWKVTGREEEWVHVNNKLVWEILPKGSTVTLTQE